MAHDNWHERLEAYLDSELDVEAIAAFEAETAASAALQAELSARRTFRSFARGVLLGETPPDLSLGVPRVGRGADQGAVRDRSFLALFTAPRRRLRAAVAVAAMLGLALLAPRLVPRPGVSTPARSAGLRAGQLVAVRFGELPGATVVLESGCYDQATDTVQ